MIMRCYSVYDRKTLAYGLPYFAPTDGAAVRTLSDAVNSGDSNLSRHPQDFVLYFIGEFNDAKGLLLSNAPLVHIVDAVSLVKEPAAGLPMFDGRNPPAGVVVSDGEDR